MWPDYSGHSLKRSKSLLMIDPLTVREVSERGRALSACQSLPLWRNVISTGIYKAPYTASRGPSLVVPSVLRVFAFRRVKFSLCVDQVYSSVLLCSEPDVRHRVLLCRLNISRIRPLPRSATCTGYSDVHVSQEGYMHPIKYFPGLVWRRCGSLPLTPRAVAMKRIRSGRMCCGIVCSK